MRDPALQMQSSSSLLAAAEFVPAGQFEHASELSRPVDMEYLPGAQLLHSSFPGGILYLPATHSVHGPPSGPVDPALQVHAVEIEPPGGASERAGQATHTFVTAPTASEYVPVPQSLHSALPDASLYLPAAQFKHVSLSSVTVYLPAAQSEHAEAPIYVIVTFAAVKGPINGVGVPLQAQIRCIPDLWLTQSEANLSLRPVPL